MFQRIIHSYLHILNDAAQIKYNRFAQQHFGPTGSSHYILIFLTNFANHM